MSALWTVERKENFKRYTSTQEHQEQLKRLHQDSDLQAKRLGSIRDTLAHKVEVEDLENEKTVYNSIREAAKGISCTPQAISTAFIKAEEKGVDFILVKSKRYKIKVS
jgi:hypothetical protein